MAEYYQTTVSVDFTNDVSGKLVWEQDKNRTPPDPESQYLRLYPGQPDTLINTSGVISGKGNDNATVSETAVFTGDKEKTLKYPRVTGVVTIETLGSTYDAAGNPSAISFSFNQAKNAVVSNVPCFGVVKISYTAPYKSYLFKFSGTPCQLDLVEGRTVYTGGLDASTLVALNTTERASATMTLTPAVCGNTRQSMNDHDQRVPKLVLEVHKNFPPRISGSDSVLGVSVSCKVRQIPDVPAVISLSSGQSVVEPFTSVGGTATKYDDIFHTINYKESNTEEVTQPVTFNTSEVAQLKYQPSSSVTVDTNGPFLDQWGNSVTPRFAYPGDTITEVDWIDDTRYQNPRKRELGPDEIAAVSLSGKVMKVFGTANATYTVTFKTHTVNFTASNPDRSEDGWHNVHMKAVYGQQVGYLHIEAPSIKEK